MVCFVLTRGCVCDSYQVYKADKLTDCWIQLWLLSDVEYGISHSHVRLVSLFTQATLNLFLKFNWGAIWYCILVLKLNFFTIYDTLLGICDHNNFCIFHRHFMIKINYEVKMIPIWKSWCNSQVM